MGATMKTDDLERGSTTGSRRRDAFRTLTPNTELLEEPKPKWNISTEITKERIRMPKGPREFKYSKLYVPPKPLSPKKKTKFDRFDNTTKRHRECANHTPRRMKWNISTQDLSHQIRKILPRQPKRKLKPSTNHITLYQREVNRNLANRKRKQDLKLLEKERKEKKKINEFVMK